MPPQPITPQVRPRIRNRLRGRPGQPARAQPVVAAQVAHAGQQQGHGVIGHVLPAVVRHPADPDAGGGGGVHVDVVVADAVARDDPAAAHAGDQRRVERLQADHRRVHVAHRGRQLRARRPPAR